MFVFSLILDGSSSLCLLVSPLFPLSLGPLGHARRGLSPFVLLSCSRRGLGRHHPPSPRLSKPRRIPKKKPQSMLGSMAPMSVNHCSSPASCCRTVTLAHTNEPPPSHPPASMAATARFFPTLTARFFPTLQPSSRRPAWTAPAASCAAAACRCCCATL